MKLIIGKKRKDGKFPVKYIFKGQPNTFGGRECGKTFNKILSRDDALEAINATLDSKKDTYSAPPEILIPDS